MFAKFCSLFSFKTVDSIVSDIDTKIKQLRIVAEAHRLEAEVHQKEIDARAALKAFAVKEEARAKAIAANFEHLISEGVQAAENVTTGGQGVL